MPVDPTESGKFLQLDCVYMAMDISHSNWMLLLTFSNPIRCYGLDYCFGQKETKSKMKNHVDATRDWPATLQWMCFIYRKMHWHGPPVRTRAECVKHSCLTDFGSFICVVCFVLGIAKEFQQLIDFSMPYIRSGSCLVLFWAAYLSEWSNCSIFWEWRLLTKLYKFSEF